VNSRYLIQFSQVLYVLASLGWGVLLLTDQLQPWHIAIMLLAHGFAGLIAGPSSQLLVYEMVGQSSLISAISLNSSIRHIATVLGPAIGGFLMFTVGPGTGMFANILLYLPLSFLMLKLPYRGSSAKGGSKGASWQAIFEGLRAIRGKPLTVGLLVISAMTSLLLGNAFQSLMPAFAERLDLSSTGYSILLSANGVGAILGTLGLGIIGSTRLRPVVVTAGALLWSFFLVLFGGWLWFPLSFITLCFIGMTSVIFTSMAQSIIQASAPDHLRGRIVGAYNLAAHGMRVVSGFIVGGLAAAVGAPAAVILGAGVIGLAVFLTAITIRPLWHSDLKESAEEKTARAVAATAS
jgi:predicted MFS family arabinose efflux permease